MFLGLDDKDIGRIGAGKRKLTGRMDVAMIQSLVHERKVDDLVAGYGHVIVDECHHVPAFSFERVFVEVKARYVTGLTATPQRRDGHQPIAEMQLGPVRYAVDAKSEAAGRLFEHRLFVRETGFRVSEAAAGASIQTLYRALVQDERRNRLITDDVVRALGEGRSPILLTERKDHLTYLAERRAEERRRREAERARYLDKLARREAEAWRRIDALIATRQPRRYDEAVTLLQDLRDLGRHQGRTAEIEERIRCLQDKHAGKPSLLDRLRRAGLGTARARTDPH